MQQASLLFYYMVWYYVVLSLMGLFPYLDRSWKFLNPLCRNAVLMPLLAAC